MSTNPQLQRPTIDATHVDPAERNPVWRLLYRDWRPTRIGRWANRLAAKSSAIGLSSTTAVLEVRGRASGRPRSTPVVVATVGGSRYLVSMLGPGSDWVKNVEAADGRAVLRQGRRRPVRLVTVPPAERSPILSEYVRVATSGRRHFPVAVGAPLSEFQAIADRYPVYRIEPAQGAPSVDRATASRRSLGAFVALELALSVPFWAVGALASMGVIPDQVMLRASWSLTPMITASILVLRAGGAAGLKALFGRIFDARRVRSRSWLLVALLLGPSIVFVQYGLAVLAGSGVPAPQLTLMVLASYLGLFLLTPAEELGWTAYVLDTAQERWSALRAGLFTGAIWAFAHAPVWLLAGQSIEWCLWQAAYVVGLRVLMTWVYDNAGRSLFAMDLLHPGFFVWWYLWPVDGTGLSVPSFYDPRSLALTAAVSAVVATYGWGARTFVRSRVTMPAPAGARAFAPAHGDGR